MTDKDERSDFDFGDITAPYFFRPLWEKYRNILRFIGETPKESITGMELFRFTHDHDTLRTIVAWNFLTPIRETELREYDQVLSTTDWELRYKITRQAREFAALETNNISDLYRAILILLRAVVGGETRAGFDRLTLLPMGFYQLVVLLNKSEHALMTALDGLKKMGLAEVNLVLNENGTVWDFGTKITITSSGILYLEQKGTYSMTLNNINITNSTVGVFALQSTLTNIDANVGNLKQQGVTDLAQVLSTMTAKIADSGLDDAAKRDTLEQVELISEQAIKEPKERKVSIVKGAFALLEKVLVGASGLATLWNTSGDSIKRFFGF